MKARVERSTFGTLPDGTAVELFTLTNANGLVAKVTNYGTIITELHVPDRHGRSWATSCWASTISRST